VTDKLAIAALFLLGLVALAIYWGVMSALILGTRIVWWPFLS
jgi:hypothetical protein